MYKFKNSESYRGITDAESVGKELESIRHKNGGKLRPKDIVLEAKDPSNLLHDAFTWDDSAAAELYRRNEAMKLLQVMVLIKDDSEIPAFLNVTVTQPEGRVQYYQNVAVMNVDEYQSALRDANTSLHSAIEKLEIVKALAPKDKSKVFQKTLFDVRKGYDRLNSIPN